MKPTDLSQGSQLGLEKYEVNNHVGKKTSLLTKFISILTETLLKGIAESELGRALWPWQLILPPRIRVWYGFWFGGIITENVIPSKFRCEFKSPWKNIKYPIFRNIPFLFFSLSLYLWNCDPFKIMGLF